MTKKIEIRYSRERIRKVLTGNDLIGMEKGSPTANIRVLSKLLWNPETNDYYDPEDGLEIIGNLSLEEIDALAEELMRKMTEVAVPFPRSRD